MCETLARICMAFWQSTFLKLKKKIKKIKSLCLITCRMFSLSLILRFRAIYWVVNLVFYLLPWYCPYILRTTVFCIQMKRALSWQVGLWAAGPACWNPSGLSTITLRSPYNTSIFYVDRFSSFSLSFPVFGRVLYVRIRAVSLVHEIKCLQGKVNNGCTVNSLSN